MKGCTIPWPDRLKSWMDARFWNECNLHDIDYENPYLCRAIADRMLYKRIKKKGYPCTALATYAIVRSLGWIWYFKYWRKKHGKIRRHY